MECPGASPPSTDPLGRLVSYARDWLPGFVRSGFGAAEDVQQATEQYEGFGLFLRAMTGLDYETAAAVLRISEIPRCRSLEFPRRRSGAVGLR